MGEGVRGSDVLALRRLFEFAQLWVANQQELARSLARWFSAGWMAGFVHIESKPT